ncbi:zinc finger CCHC domain-containing protein 7-like [Uloborus diversus]|uniref:zinc finger CCHC domain-containing protein 7-like n=1 Tax=Uloborus diversus TaxID=327109 RepID=UPI002408FA57|nr:zinc finger CCHC domain-containing protein 7-like [Uloborus diversus]
MLQKCTNCNESGHAARSCTVPQQKKCFICGGPHMANYCENTICSKCYRKGHNSRRCWQVSGTQSCAICNMYGHVKMNCPDIWRRYHLTTSNFKFTKGHRLKQDVPLYCFNCGVKGHFGSECPRPRMQSFEGSYPTWPLVISYTDHEKVSRKERENSRGRRDKQCNSQQKQSRGKHDERSWNENINHKHQSILINDKVNERTPEANAKQKSKYKLKKILKLQSDQKLVKESNFPRSPRQNILTIDSERLKKTLHLPSSSMDDIPLLAQKKTLKNREKRRRRKSSLKFRALNKSN